MAQSFRFTNAEQVFTTLVDSDCYDIECWGADGHAPTASGIPAANGGYIKGTFGPFVPGTPLYVSPGQEGDGNGAGIGGVDFYGLVDGGNGNSIGGGGGAGSWVTLEQFPTAVDGDALIVTGGGGGQGQGNQGGAGGTSLAQDGADPDLGGKGATDTTAGAGGATVAPGFPGTLGLGGAAGFMISGGGGGGLYGGGGGGFNDPTGDGGGGGGGSAGFTASLQPFPGTVMNIRGDDVLLPAKPQGFTGPGGVVRITPAGNCPCLAEGTCVSLANALQVPIEQLHQGQLVQSSNNRPVRLSQVIRFQTPSKNFVQIKKSALGVNQPENDLLIREGHPLLVAGREMLPESLLDMAGVERVTLDKPTYIYTLVTENKEFVNMQGVKVATWSQSAWEHEANTRPMRFDTF